MEAFYPMRFAVAAWPLFMLLSCASSEQSVEPSGSDGGADAGAKDGGRDATADTPICTPTTCAERNANCGQMPNGCGDVVDCGQCPADQFCGGAGPNRCGDTPCVPVTCASAGYNCGSASDGCSSTLSCGTCQPPSVCGAGQFPNKCACVPNSCPSIQCGEWSDGCGGTLSCGGCSGTDICISFTCCASQTGLTCSHTCRTIQGPVRGYSQFEDVWCSGEGQSKNTITNCSAADPDPCATLGQPDCGLIPGYVWCDVTCIYEYPCDGTYQCDGTCL